MIFNLNKMINNKEQEDDKHKKEKNLKRILSKFVEDNSKDLEEIKNNYIGSGAFGYVAEIKNKGDPKKKFVAKVLERNKEYLNESDIILEFRGPHIVKVIKIYQKYDRRIKVINNKNNMGILYSRCIGALSARGKYI